MTDQKNIDTPTCNAGTPVTTLEIGAATVTSVLAPASTAKKVSVEVTASQIISASTRENDAYSVTASEETSAKITDDTFTTYGSSNTPPGLRGRTKREPQDGTHNPAKNFHDSGLDSLGGGRLLKP